MGNKIRISKDKSICELVDLDLRIIRCLGRHGIKTIRFSDVDNLPVESTPTESVSNMEISSVTAVESVPASDTSSVIGGFIEIFRSAFRFIRENPLALGMIGISLLFLLVSMVRKIVGLGRYDK